LQRPLRVLVPLISDYLAHADEAGLPFKQAAGAKLSEARSQMRHGEWGPWLKRNVSLSQETARQYMIFAEATQGQNPRTLGFSSMNDFHRQTGSRAYRGVDEGVQENVERARREAEKVLALRLIDIGFKILKELHPDKGGSSDAMSRLNRLRDRLKQHA
jgi:hypothetical protein